MVARNGSKFAFNLIAAADPKVAPGFQANRSESPPTKGVSNELGASAKVFFTKTRIFLIAQVLYPIDPDYAISFLRVFLYNGKEPAEGLHSVIQEIQRLLVGPILPSPRPASFEPPTSLLKLLGSISIDKSQWAFVLVCQVLFSTRREGR